MSFWLLEPAVSLFYKCCFWVFSLGLTGLCLERFKKSLFTSSITKERFRNVENMRPL